MHQVSQPLQMPTLKASQGQPMQEQLAAVKRHAASYAGVDTMQAYRVLGITLAIHVALMLMWPNVHNLQNPVLVTAWALVLGLNMLRAFIFGHDCAHNSAFATLAENHLVGVLLGGLATMPFDTWRRRHLQHHAVVGIEEEYDGDHNRTTFWTKQQWDRMPWWKQLPLRILRDPLVYFCIGAVCVTLSCGGGLPSKQKYPWAIASILQSLKAPCSNLLPVWWQHMRSTAGMLAVQVVQALLLLALYPSFDCWLGWLQAYMLQMLPMGTGIGMALYHLQHHVNMPYRVQRKDHSREAAAFYGSTYLLVPWWLKWATLGIEYHHIHHLCASVPCYKLQDCHDNAPEGLWADVNVVPPRLALRSMFNVMWDESKRQYVSFPEYEMLFGWLQQRAKQ